MNFLNIKNLVKWKRKLNGSDYRNPLLHCIFSRRFFISGYNHSMLVLGIDYSTTTPAICADMKEYYFLTDNKKFVGKTLSANGDLIPDTLKDIEKFSFIMHWACDIIRLYMPDVIVLEGYAMAAKGRVFNIGENTGLLKYMIQTIFPDIELHIVSPNEIKKFATGKGNAKKEDMYNKFLEETEQDYMKVYRPKANKVSSPEGDIADSYFMCKYGKEVICQI